MENISAVKLSTCGYHLHLILKIKVLDGMFNLGK